MAGISGNLNPKINHLSLFLDEFPGAVIIVTHSELFLHHLATRLIVFNEDKVFVFEGTYQEFLDKVGWEKESGKPKKESPSNTSRNDQKFIQAEYKRNKKALLSKISELEKAIDLKEADLE